MSSSPHSPPQVHITASDRGPAINLVAWITVVTMCLASLTKVFSKSWKIHKLSGDSFFILVAMVMAIGQTIAVTEQVDAGLGRSMKNLESHDLEVYQKTAYASQMLYIASLSSAKIATLWFVSTLARTPANRAMCMAIIIFTGLWTVAAILAIAFQCPVPNTWSILSEKCFNETAFWAAIGTIDIVLQVCIIALPVYILSGLQMPWSRKIPVMCAFLVRGFVIPLTVLRVIFLNNNNNAAAAATTNPNSDVTFKSFNAALATAIGMNLDIVLACFPFLQTFINHMQHGVFTADLRVAPGHNGSLAYALGSIAPGQKGYGDMASKKSHTSSNSSKGWGGGSKSSKVQMQQRSQIDTTISGPIRGDDVESRASSGHDSNTFIIKQSTTLSVQSEKIEPKPAQTGERR